MYDVIIVGARCAGSALAFLLARAGHKVLMLDRTRFPSDTISGHYLHPAGVSCLRRWGLLDRLAAGGTPAQAKVTLDFERFVLEGEPWPAADGTAVGYCPRRWLFDPMLAGAAVEAGAQLWEGLTVETAIFEGGRVVGVRARSRAGTAIEARAALVVGADGKRSPIAASVKAPAYHCRPAATCAYYSYWGGFEAPHTRLFIRDRRFYVVVPTDRELTFIGVLWPIEEFPRVRSDHTREFQRALAQVPWIADRLPAARRAERFYGPADLDGFCRIPHGPGWALVGDAGYHRDPITAQGMTDALQHAELLASAIAEGLGGRRPLAAALEQYRHARDVATLPMYELTQQMATLAPPPPEAAAQLESLQGDALRTAQYLGVISGTVPVQDFFGAAAGNRRGPVDRCVGAQPRPTAASQLFSTCSLHA